MSSIPETHPPTMSHSGRVIVVTKPRESHSRRWNTLPLATFSGEIFRRPPFQSTSTPTEASLSDLPLGGSLAGKYFSMCQHSLISSLILKFIGQGVATCEALFGHTPPPTGSSTVGKPTQPLHAPCRRQKSPHFPLFLSDDCF